MTAHSLRVRRMASPRFSSDFLWNASGPHCGAAAAVSRCQAVRLPNTYERLGSRGTLVRRSYAAAACQAARLCGERNVLGRMQHAP